MTSICSFIASKAAAVIVYNPFDDDAVVNYFLVFRKQLHKTERKAARDAAIAYLLNNGVGAVAVNRRLHVGANVVTQVKAGLALPRLGLPMKVTLGVERRADEFPYVRGAKRSETAGYTPMSFDLAAQIRADPITNCAEIARKYKLSESMARTIKKTTSWTRPAAAV